MARPDGPGADTHPDPGFYLTNVQKYFFRPHKLVDLRVGQFLRYFYFGEDAHGVSHASRRTDEDTQVDIGSLGRIDDSDHRHWHRVASDAEPGQQIPNEKPWAKYLGARRRGHQRLCVPRSAFIEPLGPRREDFYEHRLLENLPWFCPSRPEALDDGCQRWSFQCNVPWAGPIKFNMTERDLHDSEGQPLTFEHGKTKQNEMYVCTVHKHAPK